MKTIVDMMDCPAGPGAWKFWSVIRGEASEDEVEAGLRAGEGLKLDEILAEAEREE